MTARPFVLSESTWKTVKDTEYEIVILPWGATEAHNYHLPYGTDNIETSSVAELAAERAWNSGAKVTVLPCIPFGVNTGQLDIRLCMNMNPSTQAAVLADIVDVLDRQSIPKLVIINGHGGNDFKQMIREIQPNTDVFISAINWYRVVDPKGWFEDLGDHAGEVETSVMMHLSPGLVLPLSEAGEGRELVSRIRGFREGWASAPRPWSLISRDTGVGNPRASTAEKGKSYLDEVVSRIAEFLVELAATEPRGMYGDRR